MKDLLVHDALFWLKDISYWARQVVIMWAFWNGVFGEEDFKGCTLRYYKGFWLGFSPVKLGALLLFTIFFSHHF